jgi:hypothetical protein
LGIVVGPKSFFAGADWNRCEEDWVDHVSKNYVREWASVYVYVTTMRRTKVMRTLMYTVAVVESELTAPKLVDMIVSTYEALGKTCNMVSAN